MTKVILILGAGPGLAASVARRYGQKGYAVALVARNQEKLTTLAKDIAASGIETATFTADVTDAAALKSAVSGVRDRFGRIDGLYYAPLSQESFVAATDLTPELLKPKFELFLYGLVNAVNLVLPEFLERREGVILSGAGLSAKEGLPKMSGPGPAMAAARNYLQGLQKEVAPDGIHVGLITIGAIVKNSAVYENIVGGTATLNADDNTSQLVQADPDQLALLLDEVAANPEALEAVYPS